MGSTIGIVSMVLAGICVAVGIYVFKRKPLFITFLALGALFFALPFVRYAVLTRDAYEWTIVVQRELGDATDPEVIFISDIEWITDYEELKRIRGRVGSLLLDADTTGKTWKVKGYIPLSIRAEIMYGSDEFGISRTFSELEAGSYTFTLSFAENDRGRWDIEKNDE